jgi:hypothetical protein
LRTRALLAPVLGFALTLGYAAWVQPEWEPQRNDQFQYLALARGLVERGAFTRATDGEAFFPETYRLPGYPLFLAPTCLGGCDHWRIAVLQGLLVGLVVLTAGRLARRVVPDAATAVGIATALFLPFAYYGSLALSDTPGAVLFGLALLAWVRAVDRRSSVIALGAGALFGWAALMRGVLLFAPVALVLAATIRDRGASRAAIACLAATALVTVPYVAYSEIGFARPSGGTGGLVLWLGVFQGRSSDSLDAFEREQAEAARVSIAAFDAIEDRTRRALAWLVLDDELGTRARALITHDPVGWILRALPRSAELWAGELPVPGRPSSDVVLAFATAQVVLFALAMGGLVVLARRGDQAALTLVVAIAYVWISALPFQTEARYALPAKMPAIIAAAALISSRLARPHGPGSARA